MAPYGTATMGRLWANAVQCFFHMAGLVEIVRKTGLSRSGAATCTSKADPTLAHGSSKPGGRHGHRLDI